MDRWMNGLLASVTYFLLIFFVIEPDFSFYYYLYFYFVDIAGFFFFFKRGGKKKKKRYRFLDSWAVYMNVFSAWMGVRVSQLELV